MRFGEVKMLLSNDLSSESRILFYRQISERVHRIAPFLRLDRDPYPVITRDGRIVWLLDGYTTSEHVPYSQPTGGVGNYIRNPVKVTVDAYDGAVRFYLVEPDEPVIRAYDRAFPELFQPLTAMPEDLRAHIRYPQDLLAIQARMYAASHMRDLQVFYNKEDLWTIPGRKAEGREVEMDPYYTIMRLPGETRAEFVLLLPFTPVRRDNMIAWLAARSDPPQYGKLVLFEFPKGKLVFGPRQVDARIDQDAVRALGRVGRRGRARREKGGRAVVVRSMRGSAMNALLALGLLATALVGYSGAEITTDPFDAMGVHRPVEPFPAPDLPFRTLEGHEVRLRDLRGKVVLLGFFTTA